MVFEALGEPIRRRLLELLAGGEQSVSTLVDAIKAETPMSQPAVSQHLKVLRDAGLVSVRAEGTRRFYAIDHAGLETANTWLAQLVEPLGSLAQPLDALATEVARGQRSRRKGTAEESATSDRTKKLA